MIKMRLSKTAKLKIVVMKPVSTLLSGLKLRLKTLM